MCGLAGFVQAADFDTGTARHSAAGMGRVLSHRGPDDAGNWVEGFGGSGVAFSHARLSIVGLGPEGHQPMLSASSRFVLVFNGEIYNHLVLREELGQTDWAGDSDTETLLACIENWGVRASLEKIAGMFAFALWDREHRKLVLARDRLGEKPLYFGLCDGDLIFGSELKALKQHPKFDAVIDRDSVALLMRHNYIPAPHTIYKRIFKLRPGNYLEVDAEKIEDPLPVPEEYWSVSDAVDQSCELASPKDDLIIEGFRTVLTTVVNEQMMADVPLGAFLSGGIDSSIVVALMQSQSSKQINTFSIGFDEAKYDETKHARAVAQQLGTNHRELRVNAGDALAVIPSLPEIYDEPFADSSQIPTYLLSKLTKEFVTVALSGDGGDEILGGYGRYSKAEVMWSRLARIPRFARGSLAAFIGNFEDATLRKFDVAVSKIRPGRDLNLSNRLSLLGAALRCDEDMDYYRQSISHWREPSVLVLDSNEPGTVLTDRNDWPNLAGFRNKMMYADMNSYLPDDILVKVDRAAMAVSLETRVPLLDFRVVEAAWRLPDNLKYRNGQSKWILRQLLAAYLPDELINRPKMGFSVPLASWLRGPLREWAESLLNEDRLRQEGFLHPRLVRSRWQDHVNGIANWQNLLWPVLMFQAWLDLE